MCHMISSYPGLAHYGMMMGNIRLISMISMKNICQYHLNVTVFLFQDVTHDKWAACWAPCQHKDCYFKFGYFHYGYNMAIRLSYFVIVIPILVIWYWSKTISIGAIFYCELHCVCGLGVLTPNLRCVHYMLLMQGWRSLRFFYQTTTGEILTFPVVFLYP